MSLKSIRVSPVALLGISGNVKFLGVERTLPSVLYIYLNPCFMFYHLTCIRHSHFSFWVHKLKHFMSCCSSWNQLWLGLLKDLQVAFFLISLCSVSFTLERWLLKPLMFCCIACICFLGVNNYHLNFIQHHLEYNQTLFSTWSAIYQHSDWTVMLNGSELIILQNGLFSLPTALAAIQQCTVWFGSAWSQSDGVYHVGTSHVNLRWPHIFKYQI
jgi:hypothetical protein